VAVLRNMRPRDEQGWRVPRPGTISANIYALAKKGWARLPRSWVVNGTTSGSTSSRSRSNVQKEGTSWVTA